MLPPQGERRVGWLPAHLSSRDVSLQQGLRHTLSLYPQGPSGCWRCHSTKSSALCVPFLTDLKSSGDGTLASKHILISKISTLALHSRVRPEPRDSTQPSSDGPSFLIVRTTGRNNLGVLSRSHLGPGGFRILSSLSGHQ